MLLAWGLPVDARDAAGDTALLAAARRSQLYAAHRLLLAGADIEVKNADGYTALGLAEHH